MENNAKAKTKKRETFVFIEKFNDRKLEISLLKLEIIWLRYQPLSC